MKTIVEVAQNLIKPYIVSEDKKYAANVAPVETSPATAAHTAGTQIIYNGVLYDVTEDIAANDVLATTGAGANISAADKVTEQISAQKQALSNEAKVRKYMGAANLFNYDAWKIVNIYRGNAVYENNGITLSSTSDNCFTAYSSEAFPEDAKIPVKEGDVVTLSWESTETTDLGKVYLFPNGASSGSENASNNVGKVSVTVGSGISFLTCRFGVDTANKTIHYKNIQVIVENTSDGYLPFARPNSQLLSYKDNGVLGAKNLFPCTLAWMKANNTSGTWSGNVYTHNGVGFTVNTDSDGNVTSISATRASSSSSNATICAGIFKKGYGNVILTNGFTSVGSDATFTSCLAVGGDAFGGRLLVADRGNDYSCNYDSEARTVYYNFGIASSYSASNVMFYPMVRIPSDTDPTYQPYAMTNKELTEKNAILTKTFTLSTTGSNNFSVRDQICCVKDNIHQVRLRLKATTTVSAGEVNVGAVDDTTVFQYGGIVCNQTGSKQVGNILVAINGTVYLYLNESISANTEIIINAMCIS